MANSKLKCKHKPCDNYYRPDPDQPPWVVWCSPECGAELAIARNKKNQENQRKSAEKFQKRKVKAEKKEHAQRKRRFRETDRQFRLRATRTAFNTYIRKRDEKDGCISCSRPILEIEGNDGWKVGGAWDCGHYLTVGAHPELRFEELNAHKQCKSCNGGAGKFTKKNHTVGKEYRIRIIDKIGLDKFEWLEGPHKAKKYTCADLMEIELKYKQKLKDLL